MTRYGLRLGCRWGQPHNFIQIKDAPNYKIEICSLCRSRRRWNKGYKGRINNPAYLKDHVRQFAQETGPTHRVFKKLYQSEKTIINL